MGGVTQPLGVPSLLLSPSLSPSLLSPEAEGVLCESCGWGYSGCGKFPALRPRHSQLILHQSVTRRCTDTSSPQIFLITENHLMVVL